MKSKSVEELVSLWRRHSSGHDLSSANVARTFQDSHQNTERSLVELGASPISFRSSPYLIRVNDAVVYATSSTAALMLPFIVETDVWIETFCPTNGTSIKLRVSQDGVATCMPAECVLSVVIQQGSAGDSETRSSRTASSARHLSRFFSSREAAMIWLVAYPEAAILPVEDAWRFAALIHGGDTFEIN